MKIALNAKEFEVYQKIKNGISDGDWTCLASFDNLNEDETKIAVSLQTLGIAKVVCCDDGMYLGWQFDETFPHEILQEQ